MNTPLTDPQQPHATHVSQPDPGPTHSLSSDSFAPGGYDGPPLPEPLPPTHGEPILDPVTGQREPIKYVPAGNQMIPMTAAQIADLVRLHQPTTPPPALTGPAIDRTAQRLAAGGLLAAGAGWGVGEALNAAAGLGTGSLIALAALATAWKIGPAMGRKTTNNITNNTTVTSTNNSRWFGKSTTSTTTTNTHK
ncbi:hypothetical protein Srufu_079760 (plasmid) [Streptomyces libani subsp. rufus]|nr:hypothetical protein Srufu_079760 [Streptomyces libani subsp. rufus]